MLLVDLERVDIISGLPHISEGLACLQAHQDAIAPARYDFQGGYLMIQEGKTRSLAEGLFEAHKRFLDVQVLLEGQETIEWADIDRLKAVVGYDEGTDKEMYQGSGTVMTVHQGQCYICWPYDGHKACRHTEVSHHYRKAVIKLECVPT